MYMKCVEKHKPGNLDAAGSIKCFLGRKNGKYII